MSQLTALTELYVNLEQELPGVSEQMMLQALQIGCRELCARSEAFTEDVNRIAGVEYQQDYTLTCPYSLSAQIERILEVRVNSVCQSPDWIELWRGKQLRFKDNYIPHDMELRLLKCGTDGLAGVIANYKLITDGSFTASIDSSTYLVEDLDFSAASDMYDVAAIIQTGLRLAQESNNAFVEWAETHFNFWLETGGAIGYLTAGTSGTDISGAGYLNGLSDGTGVVLAGLIEAKVAWRPDFNTFAVPSWFLDMYQRGIEGYAIWHLASMNKKPWTSGSTAAKGKLAYTQALGDARRACDEQYKNGITSWGA